LWREIGRANALGFRGVEFWNAMEKSLAACTDRTVCGETYAELAHQTSFRSGMWNRAPDRELVSSWIANAIELTPSDSSARAKALSAEVFWATEPRLEAAHEAARIADATAIPEVRATASFARSMVAYRTLRFDEGLEWAQRPREFIDTLADPEEDRGGLRSAGPRERDARPDRRRPRDGREVRPRGRPPVAAPSTCTAWA